MASHQLISYFYKNPNFLVRTSINQQGSKGIWQWPIKWCKSPMMIQKLPLLVIKISGSNIWTLNLMKHPIKFTEVPKVVRLVIRKQYYKTLVTSVINNPLSPLSLSDQSFTPKYKYWGCISIYLGKYSQLTLWLLDLCPKVLTLI